MKNRFKIIKYLYLLCLILLITAKPSVSYAKESILPGEACFAKVKYSQKVSYRQGHMADVQQFKEINKNKDSEYIVCQSEITDEETEDEIIEATGVILNLKKGHTYEMTVNFANPYGAYYEIGILCDNQKMGKLLPLEGKKEISYKFDYTPINTVSVLVPYASYGSGSIYISSIEYEEKEIKGKSCIYIIGDSTARYYPKQNKRGSFCTEFFNFYQAGNYKTEKTKIALQNINAYKTTGLKKYDIVNVSVSSQSTKSFLKKGIFNAALSQIKKGDIVFINLGHNDLIAEDPRIGTSPNGYYNNLLLMIQCIKEKNAKCVLISPIPEGKSKMRIAIKKQECVRIMQKAANEEKIEYIPFYEKASAYIKKHPKVYQKMYIDESHTNKRGGRIYSRIFARLLRENNTLKSANTNKAEAK